MRRPLLHLNAPYDMVCYLFGESGWVGIIV